MRVPRARCQLIGMHSRFEESRPYRAGRVGAVVFLFLIFPALCRSQVQDWAATIGVSQAWEHVAGNEDSYLTQWNLKKGFNLDALSLLRRDGTLTLDASGFGGAEPTRQARFLFKPLDGLKLEASYVRRSSIFALADSNPYGGTDSWSRTRWSGKLSYEVSNAARFTLGVLRITRDGTAERPLFALNELYPLRVHLNDSMTEGFLRVESLSLPVHLSFEQAYAKFLTENRPSVGGATAIGTNDPDLFVGASSDRLDERKVPTSRLSASWRGERLEVAGAFLFSRADLGATGATRTAFDLDGGRVGRAEFLDQLVGSARQDSLAGDLRMGWVPASGWTVRLLGDYRHSSNDGSLLGQRLTRLTNPNGGVTELPATVDEASTFDVKDGGGRLEIERAFDSWSIWIGGHGGSREVSWVETRESPSFDVTRTTAGGLAGISVTLAKGLRANVEYEGGSFSHYVFRTDPKTVNRVRGSLSADLGSGFKTAVRGSWEGASNPASVSDLSYDARSAGVSGSWDSASGNAGFSLDADWVALTTDTGLILPTGTGTSHYDTSIVNLLARARAPAGPFRLDVAGNYVRDRGQTWPTFSWALDGRLSLPLRGGLELSTFAQYRRYDEKVSHRDDFEVTRYGVALTWSLQ
jgi:hypothetical protein